MQESIRKQLGKYKALKNKATKIMAKAMKEEAAGIPIVSSSLSGKRVMANSILCTNVNAGFTEDAQTNEVTGKPGLNFCLRKM